MDGCKALRTRGHSSIYTATSKRKSPLNKLKLKIGWGVDQRLRTMELLNLSVKGIVAGTSAAIRIRQ